MKRGRKPKPNGRPIKWIPASAGAQLQRLQWRLLTIQDVCRIFQISRRTFYRFQITGAIPAPDIQICQLRRYKFSTLNKIIK